MPIDPSRYTVIETQFQTPLVSTLIAKGNPNRVALIISIPQGGSGYISTKELDLAPVGIYLPETSSPLEFTWSKHGSLTTLPIWINNPTTVDRVTVIEVIEQPSQRDIMEVNNVQGRN